MDTIIQLTAGRGPAECSWVVAQVLKVFLSSAKENQLSAEVLHREKGIENGTLQSARVRLSGKKVATFLSEWCGTIQWIGTSTFRKQHKRKNWFIGLYAIEATSALEEIHLKDVQFQTMRSKGPGGQHVNKVNSAVRAIHTPTKIQVVAMDSRSQHQNKKLAIERLREKVQEFHTAGLKNATNSVWEQHLELERGNPVKVFKGKDFKTNKNTKSYASKRQGLKTALRKELEN